MKKYLLIAATSLLMCAGCSKENNDATGSVDTADLIGYWHCTHQKSVEHGDSWDTVFSDTDECYIRFKDDMTGDLDSPEFKSLMELSGYYAFSWSISGNTITAKLPNFTTTWRIKSLTETSMVLYWGDGDYNITATFVRKAD